MTRALIRLAIAFVAGLSIATPAVARMAAIQTAVTLEDQSQSSIQTAAEQAVETAVRGAVAMGLPKVQLHRAVVVNNMVVVQIVATDESATERQDEPQGEGMLDSTPTHLPGKAAISYPLPTR
jgi:hypothetical protein